MEEQSVTTPARSGVALADGIPAAVMMLVTLAVCIPYRGDMTVIFRHWDGPLYMYVARTLYAIPADHPFPPLPPGYFASHFPAYPVLIRLLTTVTLGSYPWAMFLATLLSSCVAATLFYRLLKEAQLVQSPMWTALIFSVFPSRWVLCHTIGASEGLFYCFVFAMLLSLHRRRPGYVALWILMASLTRITGILLFPAVGAYYMVKKDRDGLKMLPLSLLGILLLFTYYYLVFGNFFVYFTWNMDKLGMFQAVPMAIYNLYAGKVNAHSTEFYGLLYLIHFLGTLALWKRKELFFLCLVFFLFNLFLYDWDLSRFFLPIAPFTILVALDPILPSAPLRWAVALLAAYLGIVYAAGWLPYHSEPVQQYQTVIQILHSS